MELDKLFDQLSEAISDEQLRMEIKSVQEGTDTAELPEELTEEVSDEEAMRILEEEIKKGESGNIYAQLKEMRLPQKIKLAMFGNRIVRNLLIRDTTRLIPMFVLHNPRITENEINEFAKNSNLDDTVLREIGNNATWMKNHSIKVALVSNPRVPIDVSLKWIKFLKPAELTKLSKSKNIPQVLATQCRKLAEQRAKADTGGGES